MSEEFSPEEQKLMLIALANFANTLIEAGKLEEPLERAKCAATSALGLATSLVKIGGLTPKEQFPLLELTAALYDLHEGHSVPGWLRPRKAHGRPAISTATAMKRTYSAIAVDCLLSAGKSLDVACRKVACAISGDDATQHIVKRWRKKIRESGDSHPATKEYFRLLAKAKDDPEGMARACLKLVKENQ